MVSKSILQRTKVRKFIEYLIWHRLTSNGARLRLLRVRGHVVPDDVIVFAGLTLAGDASLIVGSGSFINADCVIECAAAVTLGEKVALGNRVMLLTSHHDTTDPQVRSGSRSLKPVTVGSGAWIGGGATVLPGVHVGEGVVVAAGSVVNRDCEPHCLYAGVPAKLIKRLDDRAS